MNRFSSLACVFILAFFFHSAWAQEGVQVFEQGLEAAKKKNYPEAVKFFLQAQRLGYQSPTVDYNLGVAYYKLGKFNDAKVAFLPLLKDPEFEQLAAFNLGLVANKSGNETEAIRWFQRAYDNGQNKSITTLAAEALGRLGVRIEQESAGSTRDPWNGFASLAWVDDSNVTLANDDLTGVSSESDTALDFLGAANYWIRGDRDDGLQLTLSALFQNYTSLSQYNFSQVLAGFSRYGSIDHWRLRFTGSWSESYFDAMRFQRVLTAEARGHYPLSAQRQLRLRYRMSRIQSTDGQYNYLEGWRHQFRIGTHLNSEGRRYTSYYQLEINDRKGIDNVNGFTSYSPTRHTLRVRSKIPVTKKWDAALDVRYRFSLYEDDHNIFTDVTKIRQDNRYRLGATLSHEFAKQWEFELDYTYTKNNSNINAYSYTRSLVSAGVNWYF
jgi:tetratricopeptide (TPR) repeat protein